MNKEEFDRLVWEDDYNYWAEGDRNYSAEFGEYVFRVGELLNGSWCVNVRKVGEVYTQTIESRSTHFIPTIQDAKEICFKFYVRLLKEE